MTTQRVLVTGGSGFIAGYCIIQLLALGYDVRATIRSLTREDSVRTHLASAGMVDGGRLTFVAADLTASAGWAEAMDGMDAVLHVASPVQPGHVVREDDLIVPAREGTLRVLRAALDAGVRRLVLTSAFHAVSWGWPRSDHVFTEQDWTIIDGPGVDAYAKSKTLAEGAAWDLVANEDRPLELVAMLPVAVVGPLVGPDVSGANHMIAALLAGQIPGLVDLYFPIVDVRDVAAAHIAAMVEPEAAGQRFLLSNGPALSMGRIAGLLRGNLGASASRVPTRTIPSFVVRLGSAFNAQFRAAASDLGFSKRTSNEKARTMLFWNPRPPEVAVLDAARSMLGRTPSEE